MLTIENLDVEKFGKIKEWVDVLYSHSPSRCTMPKSKRQEWAEAHPLSSDLVEYMSMIYSSGYGLKVISRQLGVCYSQLRGLFQDHWRIEINKGNNIVYDKTKQFRSKKAKEDPNNPFRDWTSKQSRVKTNHGVQGYYINKKNQKLWLRSTYEYIYCKWLDEHDIDYRYEEKIFQLTNGEKYKPDFFIGDSTIIEIKGNFYTNRRYKADMLKEKHPELKIVVIDDIAQYTKKGYTQEIKEWKKTRLLN